MHVLVLTTHTPDCEKFWLSLEAIGHQVTKVVYDDRPHDRHDEIIELAAELRPRLRAIVYIGAIEKYHGRPVLKPETLKRLREVAPTLHICSDGAETVWWDLLHRYDREECFDAQVSIDGVLDTPIASFKRGLVLLTPCDPRLFAPKPWEDRARIAGMTGSKGHGERERLITGLQRRIGLPYKEREGTYADMAKFLCETKIVVNCPANGSGEKDHVKGRVIEAGWAGAMLLERKNKATEGWFSDDEYLTYTDLDDCIAKIGWARENDAEAKARAERLHDAIVTRHHPERFWEKAFALVKMREEV